MQLKQKQKQLKLLWKHNEHIQSKHKPNTWNTYEMNKKNTIDYWLRRKHYKQKYLVFKKSLVK